MLPFLYHNGRDTDGAEVPGSMVDGGNVMKNSHTLQIRSKRDARLLAQRIRQLDKDFYYHLPLVGGMEGCFINIRCDPKSNMCEIYTSIPGSRDEKSTRIAELVEYLWKERKFINAELRRPESEWYGRITVNR